MKLNIVEQNKSIRIFFEYLGCIIGLLLICFTYLHIGRFSIDLPLSYTGDGLMSLATVKSVVDTGW